MKLTALLPFLALSATAVSAFDKIIAYADSFTDNGNDYRASKFPPSVSRHQHNILRVLTTLLQSLPTGKVDSPMAQLGWSTLI